MTDEELEELLRQAEEEAKQAAGLRPTKTTASPENVEAVKQLLEPQRSDILPLAKVPLTGEVEFAAPKLITEPVEAAGRLLDSFRNTDYSQGVPDTTEQQIIDSLTVGGAIELPSLIKAPVPDTLFMAPIPGTPINQQTKKAMQVTAASKPPTIRKVAEVSKDAPEDLETLEKASDLYKTYIVDEKTVLGDLAERSGVPNVKDLRHQIDQSTQLTALMRVNESLKTGKLRTVTGDFDVPVPPETLYQKYRSLPPLAQKDADQYMKLRDFTDDLKLRIAKNIDVAQSQQMLNDALTSIHQIEQRTPIVTELAQDYRNVTGAVRQFMAKGKNAMLDQKALQALDAERPNYVPIDIHGVNPNDPLMERIVDVQRTVSKNELDDWYLQNRDLKNITSINDRVDSFEVLLNYTRTALQNKMENDVRGMYADAITNSAFGKNTMRLLKEDEAGKYADRTVDVYENGKKVKYVASRLQADLLRFDPHIAQHPAFFSTKKMFEMGTTGPAGLTFAPVTMMRDMLTGLVTTPKGYGKPGPLSTLAAIPEQLYAKGALAASTMLKSSLKELPFLPQGSKDHLANSMAAAYSRSLVALANEVGGVDASLLRSAVDTRKGTLQEIGRSVSEVADKIPLAKTLGHSAKVMWNGWESLFGAISEAPRYAAFKKSVKAGVDPSTAAVEARKLSGDTTRSGKVYRPDGTRIDADAVNKSALIGADVVGRATQFAREAIPYTNPTIQGLRRIGSRMIEDPIDVTLNAWKYVGLPAIAAYGWNEMMGEEYNDYAMNGRSSRDQAMTIYVAVPGLPPEQGIELPLPHELMFWNAPMTTAMYNLGRGDQEVAAALAHMGATILENGSMLGYPVGYAQAFTAAGMKPPGSIMTPWADVYEMREDNVGLMPQNVEALVRQTFGGISDTVLQSAAAAYKGGPEAFAEEFAYQWIKRTPIVKNLANTKTAVTAFTPQSEERYRKVDALNKFRDVWDEHFNPDKEGTLRSGKLPNLPDEGISKSTRSVGTGAFAPPSTPVPTNPVFKQFGELIKSYTGTNDEGMTALNSRYSVLTQNLQRLRAYTAGSKSEFAAWQKDIEGSKELYAQQLEEIKASDAPKKEKSKMLKNLEETVGERAKVQQLLERMKIDLTDRSDVNRLINELEKQRSTIVDEQLNLIKRLEDVMTQQLHQSGLLPPNVRFDVEKHLTPLVPKDIKTSSPG